MISSQPVPITNFVSSRLRFHRVLFPLIASLVASFAMLAFELSTIRQESLSLLNSLTPHISVLIETNDLLELQRFLATISRNSGATLEVVHDGKVIASSRSRESIGASAKSEAAWQNALIGNSYLVTTVDVSRSNGPVLNSAISRFVPMSAFVGTIICTLVITFVGGFCISAALVLKISNEFGACLKPVEELAHAVAALGNLGEYTAKKFGIQELDQVCDAVEKTHSQLKQTTKELSEVRADEIANESMRQLLHDLHTPIAALRQMAKIADSERYSDHQRATARNDIVALAEQLVGQISAGKQNLGMKVSIQKNIDLGATIKRIASRLKPVLAEKNSILEARVTGQILCDHDPVMLERAISNLAVNASEASATRIELVLDEVDYAPRIRLSDNGPGMNPHEVALHLKGRGRSTKSDRNGIGLSNSNLIARGHGTKLVFRRSRFGGSEFEIRFPSGPQVESI